MEEAKDLNEVIARRFIDYCKDKFGWNDLSEDVIMDVGCGEDGSCGKAILARFPNAKAVIGIDYNKGVLHNFRQRNKSKMQCEFGDILNRSTLGNYESKMSKVVSTRVFHQLEEKEEAFSNVYRLLKPGGEAAILFVIKSGMHDWLMEMLKVPKWKNAYKGNHVLDTYSLELGADHYKEMVKKIGFVVVDCKEKDFAVPYPLDQHCKEAYYKMCAEDFDLPSGLIDEFKEACLQVLEEVCARDEKGRPYYRSTELSLLLTKPVQG